MHVICFEFSASNNLSVISLSRVFLINPITFQIILLKKKFPTEAKHHVIMVKVISKSAPLENTLTALEKQRKRSRNCSQQVDDRRYFYINQFYVLSLLLLFHLFSRNLNKNCCQKELIIFVSLELFSYMFQLKNMFILCNVS